MGALPFPRAPDQAQQKRSEGSADADPPAPEEDVLKVDADEDGVGDDATDGDEVASDGAEEAEGV